MHSAEHSKIETQNFSDRPGYILLVSVLIVGAVMSATAFTLMLLGLGAELSGAAIADSAQAYENAQSCAEHALLSLRSDLAYDGGDTVDMPNGDCVIEAVGGGGNFDRTICVEGTMARSVRRMEIVVHRVLPETAIRSWEEVSSFTLCP